MNYKIVNNLKNLKEFDNNYSYLLHPSILYKYRNQF